MIECMISVHLYFESNSNFFFYIGDMMEYLISVTVYIFPLSYEISFNKNKNIYFYKLNYMQINSTTIYLLIT